MRSPNCSETGCRLCSKSQDPRVFCNPHRAGTFGIFEACPDERGRQAHLAGRLAAAVLGRAAELLAQPPSIERVDVLAAKLSS